MYVSENIMRYLFCYRFVYVPKDTQAQVVKYAMLDTTKIKVVFVGNVIVMDTIASWTVTMKLFVTAARPI